MARRRGQCFYCGVKLLKPSRPGRDDDQSYDHIVPKSLAKIWPDAFQHPKNVCKSCRWCNNRKAARPPLAWLRSMPEHGVDRFVVRLLLLGFPKGAIDDALRRRAKVNATIKRVQKA